MGRTVIETIMGAVVLAVAGVFMAFAWSHASFSKVEGYEVSATFTSVGGLDAGADVKINGIKVGTVLNQTLDPQTFDAVVKMSIAHGIRLPDDTVASISSEGLLGGKFVKLTPGQSSVTIATGGRLGPTRSFKSIEEMVGQLIFLATSENQPPAAASVPAAPAQPPAEVPAPPPPPAPASAP
ncbi:outer membrane lipid asymmetry maintenance protein MlaD [Magnetospirillum molischianum]|uniref:ABC-type transport system involved in resistance to organic solvents, periplasmic component n=1 Tax=Magnetospirillum molischianum DSM 120 TaxID=1150626 RepID=H8FPR4_MAGML|nr:outer membrane lipid asymmetry maintenance protein MlaD [Magnetospirillum molischianum]CCG40352.1 ABC-type transport system involved in resistance to organic solvents, periplasmic component [Magnetospirillum molischianum DSM 120]